MCKGAPNFGAVALALRSKLGSLSNQSINHQPLDLKSQLLNQLHQEWKNCCLFLRYTFPGSTACWRLCCRLVQLWNLLIL